MRFWDTSALVPLFVRQPSTDLATDLLSQDGEAVLWWGTPVEVESAFVRLVRERVLDAAGASAARALFADFRESALEVEPSREVRAHAVRLLSAHPLRAADALQLAAGRIWSDAGGAGFVSFDARLRTAAEAEGFTVLPRHLP